VFPDFFHPDVIAGAELQIDLKAFQGAGSPGKILLTIFLSIYK
jgi:hypothetical protein